MTNRKKEITCGALLSLYVIFNLILLYFHEPWRDEAQVWLLSRDLPIWKLPAQMAYEGHPCLWHMIMYPFAHFGLPYFMQNAVAFIILTAATALLLFRSHFPLYLKAVLVFSPFLTYYYPVIARNYCLIPLFLFLLAYWYRDRFQHPVRYTIVIALLVQSHAIMVVTAFALSLCFLIESSVQFSKDRQGKEYIRRTSPLFIPFFSALFLLYEMMSVEKSSLLHIKTASIGRTCEKILEKTLEALEMLCGTGNRAGILILLTGFVFLILLTVRSHSRAKYTVLTVLFMTFCFQFWFYTMVYSYSMQRLMTYPLLIVWGMWILRTESEGEDFEKKEGIRAGELMMCAFALLALFHSIPDIRTEVVLPYSNGREAAAFIRENIPEEAVILTDNQAECTAIFPYLARKDYIYAPNVSNYTFVTWDDHWMDRTDYQTFRSLLELMDTGDRPVYMISCYGRSYIDGIEQMEEEFEVLYQSDVPSVKGEDYKIYQLR